MPQTVLPQKVLLTLGRLPKGLELARCLHRAGCDVYIADPFGTHLSKPSRAVKRSFRVAAPNSDEAAFSRDILQIVAACGIDLIIPVSEEVLHVAQLADRLPEGTRLLAAPFERMLRVHDKHAVMKTVRAAGLQAPETHHADMAEAAALAARSDYVVKPVFGCSGAGLRFGAKGAPLFPAEKHPGNIVQSRIRGREVSSLTLVRDGKVLGSVLYQGLVFAGTVATCFERVQDAPEAEAWIERYVAAQGWTGFIAFDFMIDSSGMPWPLECNPRLTSGVHFFDHGDLAAALLDGDLPAPVRYKPQTRFQEGHTTLTKAYSRIRHPKEFLRRLKLVFGTRDVLWSWADPAPFLLMTPMSWPVLSQVLFGGTAFGEAATRDIEWRVPGPEPAQPAHWKADEAVIAQ